MSRRLANVVGHRAKQVICIFRFGVQQIGESRNHLPPVPAHRARSINQGVEIGDYRSLTIAKSVGVAVGDTRCRNHGLGP